MRCGKDLVLVGCDLDVNCDLFLTFSGMGDGGVYPWGVRRFLCSGK